MLLVAVAALLSSPPCGDVVAKRILTVHVKPWADVYVDGALAARGARTAELAVAPGAHVVSFKNPRARDLASTVVVPGAGPVPAVDVELERRPERVVVVVDGARTPLEIRARSMTRRLVVDPGDVVELSVIADAP